MYIINKLIITILLINLTIYPLPYNKISNTAFDSETKADFIQNIKQTPQIQREIIKLAVNALTIWLKESRIIPPPAHGSWVMWQKNGVFVTFEKYGKLRGCRGTLFPLYSTLGEEIINSTIGAATRDKRVEPVNIEEINHLKITVTIVGEIKSVTSYTKEVDPLIHGIMVQTRDGEKKGIMLPGEAPTQEKELLWAKKRAGINYDEDVEIYLFTGVRFSGYVKDYLDQ